MEIYCSHVNRELYRDYYNICYSCKAEWYNDEEIPLVIIGFTYPYEVVDHNLYNPSTKKRDN